jgi:glycosidase
MNIKRYLALAVLLVCLPMAHPNTALAFPASAAAGVQGTAPVVHKIDPPNWWVNFTPELTLLLTGENLSSANVTSSTKAVKVLAADSSANGHYLFVQLKISSTRPETAHLRLQISSGSTPIELPLLARAKSDHPFDGFSRDDVIYLIMPDRFADGDPSNDTPRNDAPQNSSATASPRPVTADRSNPMAYHGGDLRGIRDHLAYLHDLGVTTLWLTPIWKNTGSDYHGYHVVDFYALDDHMGSLADYQALVADAHKIGMKVLIDYVVNHTGPDHPWANDPPTPTWFHGTPAHHLEPSYSFNGLVDPHASPREYLNTLDGWFAGKLPDLNPDDRKLAVYLAQNAMWWTEIAQLDGFRLDTFPYSSRQFWSGWHDRLRQVYTGGVYPKVFDIGEVSDSHAAITSFFAGGRKQFDGVDSGLSTVFDFPFFNTLRDVVIKGASLEKLVDVLQHDGLYPHPDALVTFLGNHDDRRFISEEGSSPAKLKAAFSLLLTLRGIPQIYAGDEIGLPGGNDPDNRRDFPGGFPGDPQNAFASSGRTPEQQDIFTHVQSLLTLRKNHPALRTGKQWHIGWDENYYAFLRESPEEKLLIIYNNSQKAQDLNIPVENTPLASAHLLQPIFGTTPAEITSNQVHLTLPAQSLAVFTVH